MEAAAEQKRREYEEWFRTQEKEQQVAEKTRDN